MGDHPDGAAVADDLARYLLAVGVAEALDAHVDETPAVDGLAAERLERARSRPLAALRRPITRSPTSGSLGLARAGELGSAAAGERRAEEQRVLGQPAAHRLGRQAAGGVGGQVDDRRGASRGG